MKEQNINLTIKPFGPRNGEYYKRPSHKFDAAALLLHADKLFDLPHRFWFSCHGGPVLTVSELTAKEPKPSFLSLQGGAIWSEIRPAPPHGGVNMLRNPDRLLSLGCQYLTE
jgi:hypothetical protein